MKKKIVVIGLVNNQDRTTLAVIADFLREHGETHLVERITKGDYDVYDMTTRPERGDAFDAIDEYTELVIALHLYGIDQMPMLDEALRHHGASVPSGELYRGKDGRNGNLLKLCMQLGIPLIAWGDQPWEGVEQKTQINKNALWIYEKGELKHE